MTYGKVTIYHVSGPVHMALSGEAADRQRDKPDNTVSHFAGAIVDETLHHCLSVED